MELLDRRAHAVTAGCGRGRRTQSVAGRGRAHGRRADTKSEYFYIYAGDDPINFTDPSGACIICSNSLGIVSAVHHYGMACLNGAIGGGIVGAVSGPQDAAIGALAGCGEAVVEKGLERHGHPTAARIAGFVGKLNMGREIFRNVLERQMTRYGVRYIMVRIRIG